MLGWRSGGKSLERMIASTLIKGDDNETTNHKKKNKKRKDKAMLTVEGPSTPSTGKKAKAKASRKEVVGCTDCREAAAREKAGKGDGPYFKIHGTKGRDLQECHQVEQLVKKQRAEYVKRDKEKGQNGAGGKGRGGEASRPGRAPQNQGKPARGHEKEDCNDESDKGDEEETSE